MKTYIYSGKCRFCETGIETAILDNNNEKLYTGDIVLIYTEDKDGLVNILPDHLTAIVADNYKNVMLREPEFIGRNKSFVMGLKNAKISKGNWQVIKVKSYRDVIDGEHWKSFGFSYKSFKDNK
jgi:hypothetical protein